MRLRTALATALTPALKPFRAAYRRKVLELLPYVSGAMSDLGRIQALRLVVSQRLSDLHSLPDAKPGEASFMQTARILASGAERIGYALAAPAGDPAPPPYEDGAWLMHRPAWQRMAREQWDGHAEALVFMLMSMYAAGTDAGLRYAKARAFLTRTPWHNAVKTLRTTQSYTAREWMRRTQEKAGYTHWVWIAQLDDKVCGSCLAMHGSVHPISEGLDEHHAGRCEPRPYEEPIRTGEEEFSTWPDAKQIAVLGLAMWLAWKDGLFTFADIPYIYVSEIYGPMRGTKSLAMLIGAALAAEYLKRARQKK